ncbi:glycosyltransferase family 4 protein [Nodularia spumigena CS-584]|uniref:glycosyltransferase n=1 Tax=Nodularia spumigena TaxID=70799 RepID=UPI0000EA94B9|nr:glycosyltransferase [Nodularia spumigena]AHJ31306.1 hypothetical protein NSP_50170 [Nodularia spumigena CCY9414]EAW44784.1 hypothetical protein N9414_08709 [Nodularia spumigena CCY9414]MDB9380724.1 glycosyltransferase family 4 protein [Nodularia spumigena CS-584]
MKIHIAFPLTDKPHGGGNQFLSALRDQLLGRQVYVDRLEKADVLLFNSYPFGSAGRLYRQVSQLKAKKSNNLIVIHRVDGPLSVARGCARSIEIDYSIGIFNNQIADATIYQSAWSREICYTFGIGIDKPSITIPNACNPLLFFPKTQCSSLLPDRRIRIVATSWSSNWRKGFDIYSYLDQYLDFSRYEMTFIGNSPTEFRNITQLSPLCSKELGEVLREHDFYITASVDDPCSNSLIEALSSGLPAVARCSGGHPELVNQGGVLFHGQRDVLSAIEQCASDLNLYRAAIAVPSMDEITQRYLDFATEVWESCKAQKQPSSRATFMDTAKLLTTVAKQRYGSRITRQISTIIPRGLREDRFYRNIAALRQASWEPRGDSLWNESQALQWLDGVLERLPVFLSSMRHPAESRLYRYSYSGDLQPKPSLAASAFVAKIRFMANLLDTTERQVLSEHIRSFASQDGSISDPWVVQHSRLRRLWTAFKNRDTANLRVVQTVRAETRQSFAALQCLGTKPDKPFDEIPSTMQGVEDYIQSLDWTNPWHAGSHISHLAFFIQRHFLWFGIKSDWSTEDVLQYVEECYRQEDGAWYAKDAAVSVQQKVNGAMKMVTALDAAEIENLANPEGLIDLCLAAVNDKQACDHFNVICVLHRCQKLTTYRLEEIRAYCLDRLCRYRSHYWPWQGGFSFYSTGANHNYYNARITTGMAEPDVHGTVLMIWGIVLITEIMGWQDKFNLVRPWT